MDYLVNRNFLLVLTVGAIINTRVQGILTEPKVPMMVEPYIGSHTTIYCTFKTDVTSLLLKVNWYFARTPNFNANTREKIDLHSANVSRYREDRRPNASFLTIINVTLHDNGWYFCEVIQDVPQLIKYISKGSQLVIYSPTESTHSTINSSITFDSPTMRTLGDNTTNLTITNGSKSPSASPWWLWVALAAGCVLIVTSVFITVVLYARKKEGPVYENTKEALNRNWKEDHSPHHFMPSTGNSNKQMDTLKPHKYECRPKESPVYENTKEASRIYGKKGRSLQHCMPSKGYSDNQMDTLKPHKKEYRHKDRRQNPVK